MASPRFPTGLAIGLLVGVAAASALGSAPTEAGPTLDRKAFDRALDTVLERYVDPVDRAELLSRGLKHMVAGLDAHSHYLTHEERREIRGRVRGGGTGLKAQLLRRNEALAFEVMAVEPDSPAARAGIRPGDRILAVDDRRLTGVLGQAEADALLLGSPGQRVRIEFQHADRTSPEIVTLELVRQRGDVVEPDLVRSPDGAVAHVRLHGFVAGTAARFVQALADLRRAAGGRGLAGVVIDLRGNPGGEVSEALLVADTFVAEGILTRIRGRDGVILREERAHSGTTDPTTPIVVLQDRHSASASELLAAALQDHGRARVVGETSFGKGTVQDVIGIEDGSLLTLTIARYYSPRDRVIDGRGVRPDVVAATDRGPDGTDRGLVAALDELAAQARMRRAAATAEATSR